MLSYTDLKKGVLFIKDGEVCEVLDASFSRMQQRKAVVQAKIRKLSSGKILETTFQPSDSFEEANIERRPLLFLYQHRDDYVFSDLKDKSKRFTIKEDFIGDKVKWLKPNTEVAAVFFGEKLLTLTLPIKMDFKVTEAPPGIQGDRATSGTKAVTIETGAVVQVPPFINEGDIIRVNTESGLYVERAEKG
ncbi:MAG: elongation factor P [bacterium]|nr:elongation factor P [bacterium]